MPISTDNLNDQISCAIGALDQAESYLQELANIAHKFNIEVPEFENNFDRSEYCDLVANVHALRKVAKATKRIVATCRGNIGDHRF